MFALHIGASDMNSAKNVVSLFYESLKVLSEHPDENTVAESTYQCVDLCASDNFMNFPNEFVYLGLDNSTNSADILPSTYVAYFKKYVKNHNTDYDCTISSPVVLREAEYGKEDDVSYTYFYVNKRYSSDNVNVEFVDTVITMKEKGTYKILGIQNVAGGNAFTTTHFHSDYNDHPVSSPTHTSASVTSMTVEAARYYTMKEYDKSYNMYLKIIDSDEKNANAYYRLAIMSYERKGCRQYSRQETDRLAMAYINQANSFGDEYLRNKISNVLYYW